MSKFFPFALNLTKISHRFKLQYPITGLVLNEENGEALVVQDKGKVRKDFDILSQILLCLQFVFTSDNSLEIFKWECAKLSIRDRLN